MKLFLYLVFGGELLHSIICNNNNMKIVFEFKVDHPQTGHTDNAFRSCDLDLDSMTLICTHDLDMLKRYLHMKGRFYVQCRGRHTAHI